jgi:hypothetical protein
LAILPFFRETIGDFLENQYLDFSVLSQCRQYLTFIQFYAKIFLIIILNPAFLVGHHFWPEHLWRITIVLFYQSPRFLTFSMCVGVYASLKLICPVPRLSLSKSHSEKDHRKAVKKAASSLKYSLSMS